MKNLKSVNNDIKKFYDLYEWSLIVKILKNNYNFVSWAKNSIPTQGSLTLPTEKLNENNDTLVKKVINHGGKKLTLVTNQGYLTFINL